MKKANKIKAVRFQYYFTERQSLAHDDIKVVSVYRQRRKGLEHVESKEYLKSATGWRMAAQIAANKYGHLLGAKTAFKSSEVGMTELRGEVSA